MSAGRIPTTANSPLTAKGDLFTFSTASAKLAVGANTTVLTADSTQPTGLSWATPTAVGNFTHINASNSTTTFPTSTDVKVLFTTENYDTLGEFASSRFTATAAGYYVVNAGVGTSAGALGANTLFATSIYKNGTNTFRGAVYSVYSVTGRISARVSAVVYCDIADYIEIYFNQNASASLTGAADGPQTFVTIDRIVT